MPILASSIANIRLSFTNGDLWNEDQIRMICNWEEILREWNDSLNVPSYVRIVTENLRMASDPNHDHNPPLSHFLRFLSYEDAGMKWLVYEIIAVEWLWASKRMDYLQSILPRIDLDSHFPSFPGSPGPRTTIRQFLMTHLNARELAQVPSVIPNLPLSPPASPSLRNSTPSEKKLSIQLRLLRTPPQDSPKKDDIVKIYKTSPTEYSIHFTDLSSSSKNTTKMTNLSKEDVFEYMSVMLRLLKEDAEPFNSVQMFFPSLPTVLIPVKKIDSYVRKLFYDGVALTMDNWPC